MGNGNTATKTQSSDVQFPELVGLAYRDCLKQLHDILRPRTYLEIGTFRGDSLRLARCAAIGVDPNLQPDCQFLNKSMPAVCLFQMKSNDFFRSYDPRSILGAPIDFAFLNGTHLVEYLLRDFMNAERSCHSRSVIALHNCVPTDLHMAGRAWGDMERRSRSVHPTWWTGDVWKILLVFRQYRPDLTVEILNAFPTGLVLVRGLDPSSTALADQEKEIIDRFIKPSDETELFTELISGLKIQETTTLKEMLYKLPCSQKPIGEDGG